MVIMYFIECNGYRIPIPYRDYRDACKACDEMADKDRCGCYRIISEYVGE